MVEVIRFEQTDSEALQSFFRAKNWSDGLPVIVATPRGLEEYLQLAGLADQREREVGVVGPSNASATVELVAVNALMAGCAAQHLKVVLAAIEALTQEPFNLGPLQTATNPATPLVIVSGPRVHELEINCRGDALGPGQSPNGPIGRAVRFVLRNIGGGVAGVDQSALGQPAKYTLCLGEDPAISPWGPHHTTRGYAAEETVITVVGVESVISVVPIYRQDAAFMPQFVHALAGAMRAVGTNRFYSNGSPVVIVDPGQARLLAREGYDRTALQTALFEQSQIPLAEFPFGNFPTAEWIEVDRKILICENPSDIIVLVAGDGGGLHSTYMQPVCLSAACSAPLES